MNNKKTRNEKNIAIIQIFIVVLSTVAIAYLIGSEFRVVGAQTREELDPWSETAEITAQTNTPLLNVAKASPSILTQIVTKLGNMKDAAWHAKWKALAGGISVGVVVFVTYLIKGYGFERSVEIAGRKALGVAAGAAAGAALGSVIPIGGTLIGGIIGFFIVDLLVQHRERKIEFVCKPWQAPKGGSNCDACNTGPFPCTEYQCKSLGTACELINKNSDDPKCTWTNDKDVAAPEINPWEKILTTDYKYDPLPRGQYGVEVKYQDKECLPYFQPFLVGVTLNKLGYCRIDTNRTADFADMRYDFGSSNLYLENHSQWLVFPGIAHLEDEAAREGLTLTGGKDYELYVRCESASNNVWNKDEFVFKFCIDDAPDTSAPIIRGFNWQDNSPIGYFDETAAKEAHIDVYTNEPAQCKWSHEDKDYESMENSLTCANSVTRLDAQLNYACSGTLTGLENRADNKFYFRCNDTFGNLNIQSKSLTLVGTEPLIISDVGPADTTISGSSDVVKVTFTATTSGGVKDGISNCSYSETGESNTYIKFTDTLSNTHKTNVWLEPGEYNFFVQCIDKAGNSDTKQIAFNVETDTLAPIVVRAFHEGSYLSIITNENATCVYSDEPTLGCDLAKLSDGRDMTTRDNIKHQAAWDPTKTFYIKCADEFGNQPNVGTCSIVVSPYSIK